MTPRCPFFSGGGRARGCFVVGTAITEAVDDPGICGSIATGFRTLDANFEDRLRQALEMGELKEGVDPEALAVLAAATRHSIVIRAGVFQNDLRKIARKAIGVICR